ncbi:MAG TPA: glycosyltransferase [Desulfobacteria bacterium]|nr:glycosyltransferase [Desulfobacteria bacterium]
MKAGKVLIFSVPFGTGHYRAAEAICKALGQTNLAIRSKIVDAFAYASPVFSKLLTGIYLEILKISPRLYRFLYDRAESNSTRDNFTRFLYFMLASRLKNLIEAEEPDVVMCTHPFPLSVLARLKSNGRINVPLVAVITDFSIHSFWLYDNVDMFVVGVPELKKVLLRLGVSERKIRVTGIPIDPAFETTGNASELLTGLGLDPNIPTTLVMGGGLGLGPLEQTVTSLVNLPCDLQTIVIVGKNPKLEKKLRLLAQVNHKLRVFGHVDNIHEFMAAADLVVTKPGGLTSAEALAKGLPLLLIKPIPGHEERNLDFLTHTEVAVSLADCQDMNDLLKNIINTRERLIKMQQTAKQIGKPTAAKEVVKAILQLMQVSRLYPS